MPVLRVLQIVAELNVGGIQSFVIGLHNAIDKNEVQFDYLVSTREKGSLEPYVESLGAKVFHVPSRRESFVGNKKALGRFFRSHDYQAVHFHCSNLSYITPMRAATEAGVQLRIYHSHSTNLPKNPVHEFLDAANKSKVATTGNEFFACSDLAAEWLYKGTGVEDDVQILKNGIDSCRFIPDVQIRQRTRSSLQIDSSFVIGTVGRMCEAKNQEFLLDVFRNLLLVRPDAILMIIGDGPSRNQLERMSKAYGIESSVLFLGTRDDVPALLQAMDVFALPSKWEGFPVAALEAQAAGLPCLISQNVTKQAGIRKNAMYLPINQGTGCWVDSLSGMHPVNERESGVADIVCAGYDIKSTAKTLVDCYKHATS